MKLADAIPVIRQSVSAVQAAGALGLQPDRYGRCACPIHGGKDRNMKLFDGERGYYCFVCHSGGDVLDLVCNVNGSELKDAAVWLDEAFGLGLCIGRSDSREKAEKTRKATAFRKAVRAAEEENRKRLYNAQLDTLTLDMAVDVLLEQTRPRKYSDEFSEDFCRALAAREELRNIEADLNAMDEDAWRKR